MSKGPMTKLALTMLSAAWAFSGCSCGPECAIKTVTFVTPVDGDQVASPFDVQVQALSSDGGVIALESATLESQQPGETSFGHSVKQVFGTVSQFLGVTLPVGESSLRVEVTEAANKSCKLTTTPIKVTVPSEPPAASVVAFTFPQDVDSDHVLTASELSPGVKIIAKVRVVNAGSMRVQIVKNDGTASAPVPGKVVGSADVIANEATVTLVDLPEQSDASYELIAQILKDGAVMNPTGNSAAYASIRVNRPISTCTNTTPTLMGPLDDADSVTPGFQLRATGTVASSVSIASAAFRIDSLSLRSTVTPAAGGGVSADLTVPAAGDTTYTVVLDVTDADGNRCLAEAQVRVDLQPPTVTITSPVLEADGGVPTISTTPTTVTASFTGVNDGAQACAFRKGSDGVRTEVRCVGVVDGSVSLEVPFGQDGSYELSVDVPDALGNVGTGAINVRVALTVCPLVFTEPNSCPALITTRDLVSESYPAVVQSLGCVGKAVSVFVGSSVTPTCTGVIGSDGRFLCPVPLMGGGTRTVRGEVANLVGSPTTAQCDFIYDPSTPTIDVPAKQGQDDFAALNAHSDTQPAAPGAQAPLHFSATVPSGGRVDVCINSLGLSTGAACPTGESGWYLLKTGATSPDSAFTFPEGNYQIKIAVVANGNWNASAALSMHVDVTLPCVTDAGIGLPQDLNADLKLNIAELDGGAPTLKFFLAPACADPLSATPPTVAVAEVVAGTVSTIPMNLDAGVTFGASGDVTVALTQDVPAEADLTLFVQLRDWVGNTNSYVVGGPAAISLRLDTVAPECRLVQPTKTGTLNLTDLNAGSFNVVVGTSADGLAVPMTLSNGTSPTTKTGSTPTSPLFESGASFTPTGDATWTLLASCRDGAGNPSTATGSWRIDAVTPTISITAPAAGDTLTTFNPTATATVTGADGQAICFFGTGPVTGEAPLGCGTVTGTSASVVLNFPRNGTWAVVARASSSGGNAAESPAVTGIVVNSPLCPATLNVPVSGLVNASMVDGSGNYAVNGSSTCTGVNTTLKVNSVLVGTVVSSGGGTSVFSVPVVNGGTYSLEFCVKNVGSNPDSCTTSSIAVDTVAPACTITVPSKVGTLNLADLSGTDFTVGVTTSADGLPVSMTLSNGVTTLSQAGSSLSPAYLSSATFTLSGDSTWTLSANCSDHAGNVATASRSWRVDAVLPVVTITSPAAGSTVTSFTPTATATVTGANGQQICFFGTGPVTGEAALGCGTVASGAASVPLNIPKNGTWAMVARVSSSGGNAAQGTVLGVLVNAPLCTATMTVPSLITRITVTGGNFILNAHSSCAAVSTSLEVNASPAGTAQTNGTGDVQYTVPVANGSYSFNFCVTNVGQNPATCVQANATVVLDAPLILTPGPLDMPLNIGKDLDPLVAGVQRGFSFSAQIPVGATSMVCSNQSGPPQGATPCSDGAPGWWALMLSPANTEPFFTFPDGSYQLKVVITQGGVSNVSAPLDVVADSVAPCVAAGSLVRVQDTNGDSRLNIAELATAPAGGPQLQFGLGCGDTKDTISSVTVKSVVACSGGSPVAFSTYPTDTTFVGTTGTIVLSQNLTTTEADYTLGIQLVDKAGNTNVVCGTSGLDPAATTALRIDRVAPACTISKPAKNLFGLPDNTVALPTYGIDTQVDTSADVQNANVAVVVTPQNAETVTAGAVSRVSNSVSRTYTMASTGTNTFGFAATCTDDSGNQTVAVPRNAVVIDRDPPTCSLTNPSNGGLYSTYLLPTSVTVGGAEGQTVTVSSNGSQVGTLVVSSGVAAGSLTYPGGAQTVLASVTDSAGNACTSSINMTINAVGCSLALTAPTGSLINTLNSTPAGAGLANVTVSGHSSNCQAGQSVTLYRVLPGPRTLVAGPTGTSGSGDVSFSAVVTDATTAQFELDIDNGAGLITTVSTGTMNVHISKPSVASYSPNAAAVYIVAAGNVNLLTNGYIQDGTAGAPGDFTITLNTVTGANGGSARVKVNGSQVTSQAISADPAASVLIPVSLPQKTTGPMVIEVVDQYSNVTTVATSTITVDVIPPTAPTFTQSVTDGRAASVLLSWAPTFDDGAVAHAGYDIRWTTLNVAGANCLALETNYFNSAQAQQDSIVPWSASTINKTITLPPMNTYCIAVRALDAVGNYSTYVVPTQLANPGNVATLTNPTGTATQRFGYVTAAGSINFDAMEDLVAGSYSRAISGISSVGAVYVYWGANPFVNQTTCTAGACQEIVPYENVINAFGWSVAVGDVGGDSARADVAVGAPSYASQMGRVFLYFGPTSVATNVIDTTANAFVEFRGNATGVRLGDMVQMIDVDGDGTKDLLMSASPENGGQGRVYIFKGGKTLAQWIALRTATDGTSGRLYVPVNATTASWVLDGPTPVDTVLTTTNNFAQTVGGTTVLGDITGDGVPDFAVAAAKNTVNKVFLYSGAVVAAASSPVPTSLSIQALTDGTLPQDGTNNGFGTRSVGGVQLLGTSAKDLLVSNVKRGYVYIFATGTATGYGSPAHQFTGSAPLSFGTSLSVGNLDGDSTGGKDVVIGGGATANSAAWIFYRRPTGGYDAAPTAGFWQSILTSTTRNGVSTVVADFDGDGKDDLAVSDDLNAPGKITVWH